MEHINNPDKKWGPEWLSNNAVWHWGLFYFVVCSRGCEMLCPFSFHAVTYDFYGLFMCLTFTQTCITHRVQGHSHRPQTQYSQLLTRHQRTGQLLLDSPRCWFTEIFALGPVCSNGTGEALVSRFISFALKELKLLTNHISALWLFFCFGGIPKIPSKYLVWLRFYFNYLQELLSLCSQLYYRDWIFLVLHTKLDTTVQHLNVSVYLFLHVKMQKEKWFESDVLRMLFCTHGALLNKNVEAQEMPFMYFNISINWTCWSHSVMRWTIFDCHHLRTSGWIFSVSKTIYNYFCPQFQTTVVIAVCLSLFLLDVRIGTFCIRVMWEPCAAWKRLLRREPL